ncbi:S53 family peptidase [Burkholderia ubonensis]|uniref:S53 family peptidase n=1 Tax=Burkholderia ubonensis TaxID=101571 RepID=UPI000BA614ED|nr:S53 family peptidase [Burkholderia ubonensis]PAJ83577.1 peptidase S8/S53 subtilisin kexin sedolisin [Burkholderia ubonensis]PAJ90689.1 peptidase S8/S53 subtilisin kexin sedolisin [Burkholderia ubonensis]PAK03961.1 peptidase S8/S53 subtilisin kexin sedolisin [Burkholderia ubonensis]PAK10439.1 peptidase S8/S53 subtilisin kexin sedolisin [Burkholderia ubonensis]RQP76248.1 peptidase S8/S53 subtilisin kexin sedolisin [Burkholderia ubonensis]
MNNIRLSSMLIPALYASLLASSVAFAESGGPPSYVEGNRAPKGFARPPFHTKPRANTATVAGLTPALARHAYGFDTIANQGDGVVVAIVDAYDDPRIESDLGVFSNAFSLPPCTTSNGCFTKVYARGSKPRGDAGWSLEMALDVEWVHAIAPKAKIVLVEAASASFNDLMAAVDVAVQRGASVVSMSFGGNEFSGESGFDGHFGAPGVTFVASSGDSGTGTEYPAASPYVVAVGGTTLSTDRYGNYVGEAAWSGSGGGVSSGEAEPAGQSAWPIPVAGKRGVPDVSYDANPSSGFAVYDSVTYQGQSGWFQVGGTSAGAPQWSALVAIANSLRAAAGKARLSGTYDVLYAAGKTAYGSNYHDVTTGANGSCGAICTAAGGYDYVTGLGSPLAPSLVQALVARP